MKISAQAGDQLHEVTVERDDGRYRVQVDGETHEVDVLKLEADFYSILSGGRSYDVSVEPTRDGYQVRHGASEMLVHFTDPGRQARDARHGGAGPEKLVAAMPGKVVRVLAAAGDQVQPGQGILVLEAMKMENEIAAGKAGRVAQIVVQPGQTVEGGTLLAIIE